MGLSGSHNTQTRVERTSDRELVVTRSFDAPVHIVFEAWTRPELFKRWWAPRSMGVPLRACDMDVRTGGQYRIEFGQEGEPGWAFFGKYVDVVPNARIVWTNEEGEGEGAVTTVTFEEEAGGRTLLRMRELYPTKEELDEAFVGMEGGSPEQFDQLAELLAELGAQA
ncbi:SRPBCC family protein [Sphingomonas sp. KR3-1]|uniref:SRPBCC family protein n=1 Tax=Sphingomonas sp. KR3-1 TaxID=3156611 RepID=UPI0032B53470